MSGKTLRKGTGKDNHHLWFLFTRFTVILFSRLLTPYPHLGIYRHATRFSGFPRFYDNKSQFIKCSSFQKTGIFCDKLENGKT
jgi:hypothetical protein